MLDTYREVITPEGVPLHLPAAGPMPRALAWAMDFGIRLGLLTVIGTVLQFLGDFGQGIYFAMMFLLTWAYSIVQEACWGRTVGKRVLRLRVVAQDGAPIGWMAAITRNLLRTVDMLPFGYALGLLSSLFDRNGRRLGDMVAGTVVIHDGARPVLASVAIDTVMATPQALQPAEQAAIIAFAERAPRLSGPRQQELAALAAPISGGQGQVGVLRLYAMANWLLGRR
jgi:uncharacterized RDD family membrane protein YckC